MARKKFNIEKLREKDLPKATRDGIGMVIEPKTEGDAEIAEKLCAAIDEYLSDFVIVDENQCPGCNKKLAGGISALMMGEATFEWGLVNGEGRCKECGYPVRGHHRIKDEDGEEAVFFAMPLAYNPTLVLPKVKSDA